MEFHYVCGEAYDNEGRCGCAGLVDGEDLGDEGGREQNLVDQLPQDVQDDLHRQPDFPFENNPFLEDVMFETEAMLMASGEGGDTSGTAGTTRTADEEVIAGEAARQTAGAEEVVEAGGQNHAVEGEEHEVAARPDDPMEEDSEEDINLQTATETLRTALTDFREATEGFRAAAAVVVRARRRRAERALRALERANRRRGGGGF